MHILRNYSETLALHHLEIFSEEMSEQKSADSCSYSVDILELSTETHKSSKTAKKFSHIPHFSIIIFVEQCWTKVLDQRLRISEQHFQPWELALIVILLIFHESVRHNFDHPLKRKNELVFALLDYKLRVLSEDTPIVLSHKFFAEGIFGQVGQHHKHSLLGIKHLFSTILLYIMGQRDTILDLS